MAAAVLPYAAECDWTRILVVARVYESMVSSELSIWNGDHADYSKGLRKPHSTNFMDAVLFLRDDLLQTASQRIWGVTFFAFPHGSIQHRIFLR